MAEELKTYRGNCHCGAHVYEVKLPENFKPSECNCSSCSRKGALWIRYTNENFRFVKGDASTLTNYTFGQKTFDHKFCPTCGVQLLLVGYPEPPQPGEEKEPISGVNVRTFQHGQGVDVWKIERDQINGRSYRGDYEPPKYTGPEPKADIEGARLYTGSCHCGAVRVALKSKPLDKTFTEPIAECNCSICIRHACVWLYAKKEQVVIEGEENLGIYLFNMKLFGKSFCKTCGIPVHNKTVALTDADLVGVPEDDKKIMKGASELTPINLRIFEGLNVKDLNIQYLDSYSRPPLYVEP